MTDFNSLPKQPPYCSALIARAVNPINKYLIPAKKGLSIVTQKVFIVWNTDDNMFVGVFNDRELAIAACYSDGCGVGPAILNEVGPKEEVDWPGFWFPRMEEEPIETLQKIHREAGGEAMVAETPQETGIDSSEYILYLNGRMYPKELFERGPSREFLVSVLRGNDGECPHPEPETERYTDVISDGGMDPRNEWKAPEGWNSPVVFCPNMPEIELEDGPEEKPCHQETIDFLLKRPDDSLDQPIDMADKKPEPFYKTIDRRKKP